MKLKYYILIAVCVVILILIFLFYLVYWSSVIPSHINSYQFYHLLLLSFSSFITLCAVLVALFKDNIIGAFKFPVIKICERDPNFVIENKKEIEKAEKKGEITTIAESYETFITVKNDGNDIAKDCTIQIKKIEYQGAGVINYTQLEQIQNEYLSWNGVNSNNITIHAHLDAVVSVIKLKRDETSTTPGDAESSPSLLLAGSSVINKKYKNGKWKVTLILTCGNGSVRNFELEITWDGAWQPRLQELTGYSVREIVKNKKKTKDKEN